MWGIKRNFILDMACGCSIGYRRTRNEDNFFFLGNYLPKENNGLERVLTGQIPLKKQVCLAIFDGMGGEAYGEEAAWIAAKTLKDSVDESNAAGVEINFEAVCKEANSRICEQARRRRAGVEGATVAILALNRRKFEAVNLGDSKIFLLRRDEFWQLSVDHTDQAFLESQSITKRKPRLTQHLGIEPEDMVIQPNIVRMSACPEDRFLLCSDGLTDMVSQQTIRGLLEKPWPMSQVVEALITRAMEAGGTDNTTVICCRLMR